jgi:F0F1-type ATP synthase assembly protein I
MSDKPDSESQPPSREPDQPLRKKDPIVSAVRYSEMGFIIPSAVLLGLFLGKLADYWLHTKWLYLVGLVFGAVVGFWQMIRIAMRASKDE